MLNKRKRQNTNFGISVKANKSLIKKIKYHAVSFNHINAFYIDKYFH